MNLFGALAHLGADMVGALLVKFPFLPCLVLPLLPLLFLVKFLPRSAVWQCCWLGFWPRWAGEWCEKCFRFH